MDRDNVFNCCTTILEKTNDGDDLSNNDLALVEGACNEMLSPRGLVVLKQLEFKVLEGTYEAEPVWFYGIENLTRGKGDDRSVFWRGVRVEHFDHDFWRSEGWYEDMKKDAEKVANTCQWLEENKIEVSFDNYLKYCKRFRN